MDVATTATATLLQPQLSAPPIDAHAHTRTYTHSPTVWLCACLHVLQGYNTGLSAASASVEDGIDRVLSPAAAAADPMAEVAPVTEASFQEQLGPAGSELLSAGLAGLVRDVQTLLPYFEGMAKGSE